MRFDRVWRLLTASMILALAVLGRGPGGSLRAAGAQNGTPTAAYSCGDGTPVAVDSTSNAAGNMSGMDTGSPAAGMDMSMEVEFDQLYIDMMIPHHRSILALAEAALPRLADERLVAIAEGITADQTAEIEELRGYREDFYGSPDPMPMDAHMMGMTMQAMPGMGSMDDMALQMDAKRQVAAFCGAEDSDLAFIDLVIPHHEMAIAASRAALEQATHEEIIDVAERVIDAQEREIKELSSIRLDFFGSETPRPSASTSR